MKHIIDKYPIRWVVGEFTPGFKECNSPMLTAYDSDKKTNQRKQCSQTISYIIAINSNLKISNKNLKIKLLNTSQSRYLLQAQIIKFYSVFYTNDHYQR